MQAKSGNNNALIIGGILAGIVVVVSIIFLTIIGFKQGQKLATPSLDNALKKMASELNQNCPMIIDQDTRLDNVLIAPEKTVKYNYTLVNLAEEDVNIDNFDEFVSPRIINNVRTNPDLATFRKNDVIMEYNYFDKNGVFLYRLVVTPDMYK